MKPIIGEGGGSMTVLSPPMPKGTSWLASGAPLPMKVAEEA